MLLNNLQDQEKISWTEMETAIQIKLVWLWLWPSRCSDTPPHAVVILNWCLTELVNDSIHADDIDHVFILFGGGGGGGDENKVKDTIYTNNHEGRSLISMDRSRV